MPQRICMVSDFFYPNTGGVETHIWVLSQFLISQGHKVIVVTHEYEGRQGIRMMTNGLKVYYLPLTVCFDQIIFPTFCSFFGLFRNILIRERIGIVHCHQSGSSMAVEALLYARALGYHICYTDHSLFGFSDIGSIHINKILEAALSEIDHVICVSNACRENLVLRARLYPSSVSTIAHAVDSSKFIPSHAPPVFSSNADPTGTHLLSLQRSSSERINIIVLSRLVPRKGIDLLAKVIPMVCASTPHVHFIIGGDGPKRLLLEEMKEKYSLQDRIELLGSIPHHQVREVLIRGQIFLNCSLTESFCIALLEAASCGLYSVSTNVGGVPEVLPQSMISLADPDPVAIVEAIHQALNRLSTVDPWEFHERVKSMYDWSEIARRTTKIYDQILVMRKPSLIMRLHRYLSAGPYLGPILGVIVVCLHFLAMFLEVVSPMSEMELAAELDFSKH